jgi:nicotinate phosphoribosyltransferase
MESDVLTLEGDYQEGSPLIQRVMASGKRLSPPAPLAELRERTLRELSRLPEELRTIEPGPPYPVRVASKLRELAQRVDERQSRMDAAVLPRPLSPGPEKAAHV